MGGGRLWGISVTLHGINSSQSKNTGKIQLSIQLLHLSIIFENICMVLMIIINSFFDMGAANLFVHKMSSFRGLKEKKILEIA